MSEIGLKIQIGDTNIELSGDAEIVKNIFNDIRENGLGKININQKPQNTSTESKIIKKSQNENKIENANDNGQKIKKAKSTKTSTNITSTYQMVELNIDSENRGKFKEDYTKYKTNTNVQQILVLAYLLREYAGLEKINTNVIFTALRTVGAKASFNIPQAFRNMKNRNNFLSETEENGEYKLTPIGEDEILYKLKLEEGVN